MLADLGVTKPHSRPHVSDDNPYSPPVRIRVYAELGMNTNPYRGCYSELAAGDRIRHASDYSLQNRQRAHRGQISTEIGMATENSLPAAGPGAEKAPGACCVYHYLSYNSGVVRRRIRVQVYDGWEPLQDDDDPQKEKLLGKGGQGIVCLVRSPERLMKRSEAQRVAREQLIQVGEGRWDIGVLVKSIMEAGRPDPVGALGALKKFIIPSDNKAEEARVIGRLESEVKALQALQGNPGVLKLLYANVAGRFIVTEYHERGTLDKHLDTFKGDALAALEAYKPLVDAVCKIHEEGAIHRDIKTENIFVTKTGNLVLGDFGIVFLQEGSQRLTATYERVGSHEWMAPWANKKEKLEQSEINTALDIFPLAKVLWSMIAGHNGPSFWEYSRDENNLEMLFPGDPAMPLINKRIFSTRIVREEQQCDSSAQSLRKDVEELIGHIKGIRKFRQEGAEAWPCQVCGRGRYRSNGLRYQLTGFRQGGPIDEQNKTLYVYICDHCGHAELFDR